MRRPNVERWGIILVGIAALNAVKTLAYNEMKQRVYMENYKAEDKLVLANITANVTADGYVRITWLTHGKKYEQYVKGDSVNGGTVFPTKNTPFEH